MTPAEQKQALRRELRARARALDPEACRRADRALAERLFRLEVFQRAGSVFCFVGTGWEIDTRPILEECLRRGKRLCVPLCTGPGLMEARQLRDLACLRPGCYGIPEPDPALCPAVEPGQPELLLTPCLSATRRGERLGQGGGYYDRYLPETAGTAILLCREAMLSESLPREPWDISFDHLLTEAGLWNGKGEREDA